jgi:uncharacterized protein (TIGR03663 family)
MKPRTLILINLVLLVALGLRLWDLDLKPMHHDEGVNGWFLLELERSGEYRYDPANYHGPFLYYAGLAAFRVLGVNDYALRLMPALFGSFMLLLLLGLRRQIGDRGVLFAALLLALSPSNVFFAREAIHETFFVAFTLLFFVYGVRWLAEGRRGSIAGALLSLAFLVTVKETWVLTLGAMGLALVFAVPERVLGTLALPAARRFLREDLVRRLEESGRVRLRRLFPARPVLVGVGFALAVLVVFYSSFFTHPGGILGPIQTFRYWGRTGEAGAGHEKPFLYYIGVLFRTEPHLLAAGIPACIAAFAWRSRIAAYLFFWFLVMTVGHSMIPYKTPWLLINFTLPLALLGGWFLGRLAERTRLRGERAALALGAIVLFASQAAASIDLNFRHYDDESRDPVYVHTRREVYGLLDRLETVAREWPAGYDTVIQVTSPEYWPLTWYLRDFERVTYHGQPIERPDGEIVIASRRDEAVTAASLPGEYHREYFDLRPGAPLVVYYRSDLWAHVFGEGGPGVMAATKAVDPSRLEPGVQVRFFPGREPVGKPLESRVEREIGFWWDDVETKPFQSPFSVVYEGYLHVTRPGLHLFATNSDDGSVLFVDGEKVVDNGGDHALQRASGSRDLGEGYHPIYLEYFDSGWGAMLEVFWTPPGGREEKIPAGALFHVPE